MVRGEMVVSNKLLFSVHAKNSYNAENSKVTPKYQNQMIFFSQGSANLVVILPFCPHSYGVMDAQLLSLFYGTGMTFSANVYLWV